MPLGAKQTFSTLSLGFHEALMSQTTQTAVDAFVEKYCLK